MPRYFAAAITLISATTFMLALPGCFEVKDELKNPGGSTTTGSGSITVTWDENRDSGVNSSGGGYRVYYSRTANVATASNPNVVDVPFSIAPSAPTQTIISNLAKGDWYIKVVAYSAYNPHNVSGGAKSSDSAEFKITIQ